MTSLIFPFTIFRLHSFGWIVDCEFITAFLAGKFETCFALLFFVDMIALAPHIVKTLFGSVWYTVVSCCAHMRRVVFWDQRGVRRFVYTVLADPSTYIDGVGLNRFSFAKLLADLFPIMNKGTGGTFGAFGRLGGRRRN